MRQTKEESAHNVIDIGQYRDRQIRPTITISLREDGTVDYRVDQIQDGQAFQALIGCYIVAGQLLKIIKEGRE